MRKDRTVLIFLGITSWFSTLCGIDVGDIQVIPRRIVETSGYSGDLAVDMTDGSLHCIWASSSGELKYKTKTLGGVWSETEVIPLMNLMVYADEPSGDNRWARKSCGLTVDEFGVKHIVFSVIDRGVFYISGRSGAWSDPLLIAERTGASCHPEITAMNQNLVVIWEDAEPVNTRDIYEIQRIHGKWTQPELILYGDNPDIILGENGRVYLIARFFNTGSPDYDWDHNVFFGSVIPGFTDWEFKQLTHSTYRVGKAPRLAMYREKIYLSWSTSLGGEAADNPDSKGQLYCARAPEPGLLWDIHFSPNHDPIYTVSTGDPYGVVSVYSDNTVFYANGKAGNVGVASDQSFKIWLGTRWSGLRPADWEDGLIHLASDGRTVWAIFSSTRYNTEEVSVSGYKNPYADYFDFDNSPPRILSYPDTLALTHSQWNGQCTAEDADHDDLVFSLTEGPEGCVIDSLSGEITYQTGEIGIHLVTVKVNDRRGKFDVQTFRLHVTDQFYHARFTTSSLGGAAPQTVQFTDLSSGPVENYFWDFGDGSTSIQQNPVHTYQVPGVYSVQLTVGGHLGSDSIRVIDCISVLHPAPAANFSAQPLSGDPGVTVQFQDQSSGTITSWHWLFGDGQSSDQQSPSHQYMSSGHYAVRLTVTGPGGSDTFEAPDLISIDEIQPPAAQFTAEPKTGYPGQIVQFQDQSGGPVTSWHWLFGDGQSSDQQSPSHQYMSSGHYTVRLTVTGPGGSDMFEAPDLISINEFQPPAAQFTAEPKTGYPGQIVQFQDQSGGPVTSWHWLFGDGQSSDQQSPSHQYMSSGHYTVRLTVTGPGGADTSEVLDFINIAEFGQPVSAFTADPLSGYAPLTVTFHNESLGDLLDFLWYFGDTYTADGGISHETDPVYVYNFPGVYSVLLEASGPEQTDTEYRPNYIHVIDPTGIEGQNIIPADFALYPNRPNPFNSETKFQVDIPKPVSVRISVFDARGKWIANLMHGFQSAGQIQITWNGSDHTGNSVPSGLYLIRVEAGTFTDEMKVMVLK
jgi:PKD repeat protein